MLRIVYDFSPSPSSREDNRKRGGRHFGRAPRPVVIIERAAVIGLPSGPGDRTFNTRAYVLPIQPAHEKWEFYFSPAIYVWKNSMACDRFSMAVAPYFIRLRTIIIRRVVFQRRRRRGPGVRLCRRSTALCNRIDALSPF